MIMLTKLNKTPFWLNVNLIETIESIPDTRINLRDEKFVVVRESVTDVVDKIIAYNQLIYTQRTATEAKVLRGELGDFAE